ncbi:MAG: CBS domain-containing protein [Bdellovibrionia bacterium]
MKKEEPYLQPSQAVKVRADATIIDCILLMKKFKVGSVLVMSDNNEDLLVGIFTERDLLNKFEYIQNYENLKLSIRTVMTSPLKTLDISELGRAHELMLKHGIRHLPVTVKNEDGTISLAGVISMRDVLKRALLGPPEKKSENDGKQHIIIFSRDNNFINLIRKICPTEITTDAVVDQVQLDAVMTRNKTLSDEVQSLRYVIDIESFSIEEWSKAARLINSDILTSAMVFVYNPVEKNKTVLSILKELNKSKRILVLSKPVNVLSLSDFITSDFEDFTNLSKEKDS